MDAWNVWHKSSNGSKRITEQKLQELGRDDPIKMIVARKTPSTLPLVDYALSMLHLDETEMEKNEENEKHIQSALAAQLARHSGARNNYQIPLPSVYIISRQEEPIAQKITSIAPEIPRRRSTRKKCSIGGLMAINGPHASFFYFKNGLQYIKLCLTLDVEESFCAAFRCIRHSQFSAKMMAVETQWKGIFLATKRGRKSAKRHNSTCSSSAITPSPRITAQQESHVTVAKAMSTSKAITRFSQIYLKSKVLDYAAVEDHEVVDFALYGGSAKSADALMCIGCASLRQPRSIVVHGNPHKCS